MAHTIIVFFFEFQRHHVKKVWPDTIRIEAIWEKKKILSKINIVTVIGIDPKRLEENLKEAKKNSKNYKQII